MDDDAYANMIEARMYFAVDGNDLVSLKNMVDEGLNVDMKFEGSNQLGKSVLHLCCEKGHYEAAKILLEGGAKPTVKDKWFQTPLVYSVCTERVEMVELMISAGCNINAHDRFKKTALHYAMGNEEIECLAALLDAGANANIRDDVGRTPLWQAVYEDNNVEFVQLLIAKGCNVNIPDTQEKRMPIQCAINHAKKDSLEYVKLLLQAGATVNHLDQWGHSAFMSVVRRRFQDGKKVEEEDLEMAKLIVEAGFKVDISSIGTYWFQYCGSALKFSVSRGAEEFVKILLEAGANPDILDDKLGCPLLEAASSNHIEVAKLLLKANCECDLVGEIKMKNVKRITSPFKCALTENHFDFAQLLVLAGYDLKHEDYLWTNQGVPDQLVLNLEFWSWLKEVLSTPRSLLELSRKYLRGLMKTDLNVKVHNLPVPGYIKQYIMMDDLLT